MQQQKENPIPECLAADGTGFDMGDSHRERIRKLSSYKRDALNIVTDIERIARINTNNTDGTISGEPFWIDALKPIYSCANYLNFRHYFEFEAGEKKYHGEPKLFQVFTCKRHLICPVCALLRQQRLHRRLYPILQEILQGSGLIPHHLTLTVPNTDDLMEAFVNLITGLRELFKIRRFQLTNSRYKQHTEFSKVEGAVYAVEVKRGKTSGKWHPHVHMMLLCREKPFVINEDDLFASRYMLEPERLPAGSLNSEWYKLTGGFMMRLDEIKTGKGDDLFNLLCEVVKYGIKPGSLPAEDIMTVYGNLRGKRLLGTIGNLRGVKIPEAGAEEEHPEMLFDEYFYRFLTGAGYCLDEITERGQLGS